MPTRSVLLLALVALCAASSLAAEKPKKPRLKDIPDATPALSERTAKNDTSDLTPEERKRLTDKVATSYYQSGVKAESEGRLTDAQSLYERTLVLEPAHPMARRRLDALRAKLEKPKPTPTPKIKPTPSPSVRTVDPAADLTRRYEKELAELMKEKDWDRAETAAKKILALNPGNTRVESQLKTIRHNIYLQASARGADLEKSGNLRGAIDAYQVALARESNPDLIDHVSALQEKLAGKNKKDSDALYLDALAASQKGKHQQAIDLCKQALRLNPNNLQARRMLDRLQP